MKIMKKILKSKVFIFVVTAITFSSISVYAAGRYYASQIDYEPENSNFNVTNMEQALNALYTTQNTTVNNLNSQITTKDQTISDLQTQVESLTAQVSSTNYVVGDIKFYSETNNVDLGFYPTKVIIYVNTTNYAGGVTITRTGSIGFGAEGSHGWTNDNCKGYFDMTNNGFAVKQYVEPRPSNPVTWTYIAYR